jgi:chromosome partitioning protein
MLFQPQALSYTLYSTTRVRKNLKVQQVRYAKTQTFTYANIMIITVASFKGGVGKTTSAVHLAAYFSTKGSTVLIDGDPNRSATGWSKRGTLPFTVIDERVAAKQARNFQHIVIDTEARPEEEDLKSLTDGCDLLVIPTTPDALSLDAMKQTVTALNSLGTESYKILLTIIPPKPSTDGQQARLYLTKVGLPLFQGTVRRLVAFQKAALAGVPVYEVADPRAGEAWRDYEVIGEELLP